MNIDKASAVGEPVARPACASRGSILVVDPDPRAADYFVRLVSASGMSHQLAYSAVEARSKLCTVPDVYLLMIHTKLPDASGIDLGESVKAEFKIPFIVIVDRQDIGVLQHAIDRGAYSYFFRPNGEEGPEYALRMKMLAKRLEERCKLEASASLAVEEWEKKKLISIATGAIMERFGLTSDDAFDLMRYAARSRRSTLVQFATEVINREAGLELLQHLARYLKKRVKAS